MSRILLVEDDYQLVSLLTQLLNDGGLEVLHSDRMDKGLVLFRENPIQLVITDFHIVQGSGRRLLHEVRKIRWTPVFLMTGTPFLDTEAVAAMPFDKVFIKPFTLEE